MTAHHDHAAGDHLTRHERPECLAELDALVRRCETCDAPVLPAALMRTPHVCGARYEGPHHVDRTARVVRELVYERQSGVCLACHEGMDLSRMHAHHRQRRRDFAGPEWCACNIVGLHPDCHVIAPQAVHQNPERSRGLGLIVSASATPAHVRVVHVWPWPGRLFLGCDGLVSSDLRDDRPAA